MERRKLHLKGIARHLRRNMTSSERVLWSHIRRKRIKGKQFYRQRPLGSYIVDFYCPSGRLIVEIDGSGHMRPEKIKLDQIRDAYFESIGLRVIRCSSREVMTNIDGVLRRIYESLAD